MNENVRNTCDHIMANREALKNKMFWEMDGNAYAIMAGLLTTANNIEADPERYQKCKDMLNKNAGIFSEMRGMAGAVVVIKMMMAEDPEAYLKGVTEVYNRLCSLHKLSASPYMVMAAMNIFEHNGIEGADTDIARMEELYKELRHKHPLIVGDQDRGYLSMIATSGMDMEGLAEKIEDVYEISQKMSYDKSAVHSMAQMLAFSVKSPEEKYEFINGMLKGLEANGTPIDKSKGLPILGALVLLGIPKEQLIQDITDASNYLNGKEGFRWYNEGKALRTAYAALAVFMTYAKESKLIGSTISSITMNIMEEIIMLIIVISVTTTTVSSITVSN